MMTGPMFGAPTRSVVGAEPGAERR